MVLGIFSCLASPSLTSSLLRQSLGAVSELYSWQVLALFSCSPFLAKAFLKSIFSLFTKSKP